MPPASLENIAKVSASSDQPIESETHCLRSMLMRLEVELGHVLSGLASQGATHEKAQGENISLFCKLWGSKDSVATAALQLVTLHTRVVELEAVLAASAGAKRDVGKIHDVLPPPTENDFQIIAHYAEKMQHGQGERPGRLLQDIAAEG